MYKIILVFLIIYILLKSIKKPISHFANTNTSPKQKPYIWLYWDNVDNNMTPPFIELCRESVYKNCSEQFNIILLDKTNIDKYLPEINSPELKDKLDKLMIAHKVDIYRIMLLNRYGGIYIDSDVIVMKDLSDIIKKLEEYDFVGFGCTGNKCKSGYGMPSNWILASRPNTRLMKNILDRQMEKLNQTKIEYHTIGKMAIWDVLGEMIKNGYKYFHYPNTVDGTRDKRGYWVTSDRVFSEESIDYDDENNFLIYVFYNSEVSKKIKNLTKEELLNKNWNFTKYLKKALKR